MQSILITGATGFIGQALTQSILRNGHKVIGLTRKDPNHSHLLSHPNLKWRTWDTKHPIDLDPKVRLDAVIHLAGETVAQKWSEERKDAILRSRVESTHALVESLRVLPYKPQHVLFASAIGFYGSQTSGLLDERGTKGTGFLADVVSAWEEASLACDFCPTTVLRLGVVLGHSGGMLEKLAPIFKAGLGGAVGNGKNTLSWIHLEDVLEMMAFYINKRDLSRKVVNAVSPNPVTNSVFSKALASALHRPCIFTVPRFIPQMMFGAMADETILSDQTVVPVQALADGFKFRFPEINEALRNIFSAVE